MTQMPTQPPAVGYATPGSYARPHRGVAILVLGILGLVVCGICGIIAWVMGNTDIREMEQGTMDPSGLGLTKAGKICGMIAVALNVLLIGIGILMMVLGLFAGAAGVSAG